MKMMNFYRFKRSRVYLVRRDFTGLTPLHRAVLSPEYDNTKKIIALLDQGASPAARTTQGDTPLHLALESVYYLDVGLCDILIDERLFLFEENPFGSRGLSHCHIACMFGNMKVVRSFLDSGVDPNLHRTRGPFSMEPCTYVWHDDTCLHVAMHAGRSDVVRLLLERGADPNARNSLMCTPLHSALYDFYGTATKVLLEHGADVNARNCQDMTPLHVHCFSHNSFESDLLKALLEAGADVNLVHRFGVSALQDAERTRGFDARTLMIRHVVSLQEAGFDISNENLKSIFEFEECYDVDISEYREVCRSELECMNRVRLDARTTLREALRVRNPRRLQRLAANEKFGRVVADEAALADKKETKFPIYGHLVRLQYRRGARTTEAVVALQELYACSAKADNGLPPECAEVVVYYLTCEDLWRLIQAASP